MRLRAFEFGVFGLLFLWQLAAAAVLEVEFYDGFDSIGNAMLFLGQSDSYQATRGPMMALLLIPSVLLHGAFELHPLDLRPAHFTIALLHGGYLLGIYLLMRRHWGRSPAVLAAFAAAVPCMVFFGFGPFISHDLLPGVFLLWMLVLAEGFMRRPNPRDWAWLVLLGALSPLVKHTFGLFWMVVFGAQLLLMFWPGAERTERPYRSLAVLAAGGLASGALVWLVLGFATRAAFPDAGFLARPWQQIDYMLNVAPDKSHLPAWVYLRNIGAFGWLPMLLVLPGLALAFTGSRMQRGVALAWIMMVAVHHLLSMREVRYLVILCPLTAFLIVPVVERVLADRRLAVAALAVWVLNVLPLHNYSIGAEAARVFQPFYRNSEVRAFLAPLEDEQGLRRPVVMNGSMISTTTDSHPYFPGDIYHRLFHFGVHHLRILYRYAPDEVAYLPGDQILKLTNWPDRSAAIVTTTQPLTHVLEWKRQAPRYRYELIQSVALAEQLDLVRGPQGAYLLGGAPVDVRLEGQRLLIRTGLLQDANLIIAYQGQAQVPVRPVGADTFAIDGVNGFPPSLRLRFFRAVLVDRHADPNAK